MLKNVPKGVSLSIFLQQVHVDHAALQGVIIAKTCGVEISPIFWPQHLLFPLLGRAVSNFSACTHTRTHCCSSAVYLYPLLMITKQTKRSQSAGCRPTAHSLLCNVCNVLHMYVVYWAVRMARRHVHMGEPGRCAQLLFSD